MPCVMSHFYKKRRGKYSILFLNVAHRAAMTSDKAEEKNTEGHMANRELAEYIMEQFEGLGEVRNIPMMGGYIFYYRERIFGGIYGNGFLVKETKASRAFMPDSVPEPPYDGAKPMLPVTILEDRDKMQEMVRAMYPELPERKPRVRKR